MKKEPKAMCSAGAAHIFKRELQNQMKKFLASKIVLSYFITLSLYTQGRMYQAKKLKEKKNPQIAYPAPKYLKFQTYPIIP